MTPLDRRALLKKAAVGGAVVAWSVPTITSVASAQAGGSTITPGSCFRVKWNTVHANFQSQCHGDASKDENNRAPGFQLPDPGSPEDAERPDRQCCNDQVEWKTPAPNAPLAYLNDVVTVTGNSTGALDQGTSMTFTVDQTKAPGCYLADPSIGGASYEKIVNMECELTGGGSSGVKAQVWQVDWTGTSGNTGGKVPIYIKFFLHCGPSNNCDETPLMRTTTLT